MSDRDPDELPKPRIADRFALAQSWAMASEIARRHDNVLISRVEDDQFYGILIVHDGPVGPRVQFDLPQGATWQSTGGVVERLGWHDIVTLDDPLEASARLSAAAGFGQWTTPPMINRRTIAYSVAACILAAKINEPSSWQVVPLPLVASELQARESLAILEQFVSTADQVAFAFDDITELFEQAVSVGKTPYWHDPFWIVTKDLQPVLVLDESGYAHLPTGVLLDLMSLYDLLEGDVSAVTGVVLMPPDAALATNLILEGRTE